MLTKMQLEIKDLLVLKNTANILAKFKTKLISYIKIRFLYLERLLSTLRKCTIIKR